MGFTVAWAELKTSQAYSAVQARHSVHLKKIMLPCPGLSPTAMYVNTMKPSLGKTDIFKDFHKLSISKVHISPTYRHIHVCGTTMYMYVR